jgi:DNA-binding transcriptional LysR family regulator
MIGAKMTTPNLQDVDLRLLRVFQSVARHRGLSAAQEDLGVSQATISNQLKQLEMRLGLRLCDRGRGGFALTHEGRVVLEAARNLFHSIESFRGTIGTTRGELIGDVHFGTVDAMWTNRTLNLHAGIADFADQAPKVLLSTEIAAPQDLFQGLAEDRHHLILAPTPQLPSRFVGQLAFCERQSLYCGLDHPLFDRAPEDITLAEVRAAPYAARSYMQGWVSPLKTPFNIMAETSHMESLAILILSGRYIGYLPSHFAKSWEESGQMRRLVDDQASYDEPFFLAYRRKETYRAVEMLFNCIRRRIEKVEGP